MLEGAYDGTVNSGRNEEVENSNSQQIDSVIITDSTGQTVVVYIKSGTYYIDATDYTQWVYINLHTDTLTITTSDIHLEDFTETNIPQAWDLAQHRYDVKTNGCAVMMTDYHSIEALERAGIPTEGAWVKDELNDTAIVVDMSHMLEGYLVYAPSYKNAEASRWMNVDISTMPPIYTMYSNVMLYRFEDDTYAAIQLANYMSTDRYQIKGWMTVNYKYPMFLKPS